jgi:hypothetical protein
MSGQSWNKQFDPAVGGGLTQPIWQFSDFLRGMRRRLRFGDLSRAPLQLLRVELTNAVLRCDWMVREADTWDANLPEGERERKIAEQALRDAIVVSDLIFSALPGIDTAILRAYRPSRGREPPEIVIAGSVARETAVTRLSSLVMRAKLYGFRFDLNDGALRRLHLQEEE